MSQEISPSLFHQLLKVREEVSSASGKVRELLKIYGYLYAFALLGLVTAWAGNNKLSKA